MSYVLVASGSPAQEARRAGLSDGYYGYAPQDTGTFSAAERAAYRHGYREGKAKNRGGKAW